MGSTQSALQNPPLESSVPLPSPSNGGQQQQQHPQQQQQQRRQRQQPIREALSPAPRPDILSYFLPIKRKMDLQHVHLDRTREDISRVTISLQRNKRLPPEIIVRILDEAEYWHACRIIQKKPLTVTSGQMPRSQFGVEIWNSGQEEELPAAEMAGLVDEPGKVWYLVSKPIGCGLSLSPRSVETSSPQGRAQWTEEDKWKHEEEAVDQSKPGTGAWLREIVVETMSVDQGWSDLHEFYGMCGPATVGALVLKCRNV